MKQIYTYTIERYNLKYESVEVAVGVSMSFVKDFIENSHLKPKDIINIQHHIESIITTKISVKAEDYPNSTLNTKPIKTYSCVTILNYYR